MSLRRELGAPLGACSCRAKQQPRELLLALGWQQSGLGAAQDLKVLQNISASVFENQEGGAQKGRGLTLNHDTLPSP